MGRLPSTHNALSPKPCAVVLVFSSERLNALGARHWQRFAGQNYFDGSGIFVSAVLSAPLVFTMFVTLVRPFLECDSLLRGVAQSRGPVS